MSNIAESYAFEISDCVKDCTIIKVIVSGEEESAKNNHDSMK